MKKNFKYAILSVIALVGAVNLTSCSSSDDVVENPNFNPETNAVKTQFTISVTGKAGSETRMGQDIVQGQTTPVFRGLDQMVLIPYGAVDDNDVDGARLAANITLNVAGGTANTLPSFFKANSNSYVYSDVDIPLGTYGFLFYGKAIDETAGTLITNAADKFTYGYLTPSALTGEKETFSFSLASTVGTSTSSKAGPLLEYVKNIAAATGWYNAENAAIQDLYANFVKMKAGSSSSIRAALEDLYESLMNNQDAVSEAVCTAILTNASYSPTPDVETGYKLTLSASLSGYPADINLPDGAVALVWSDDEPAVPSWQTAAQTDPSGGEWNTGTQNFTALDKYVFPPSLYYRANSPVLVSMKKESDNYGTKTWDQITNASTGLYKDGDNVNNKTQSVAIKEQIQYAVAQLESTIKIASATLKDRFGEEVKIGTEDTDDGTIKVTGLLIGGQQNVDWEFLPLDGSSIYTIYDKEIPSSNVISGTESLIKNYTLALESDDQPVYVAIEFENNAKDFSGIDGLVAKGSKFYLVGALDPEEGTGSSVGKVFVQDYKTTATFTIKENAVKSSGSGTPADPDIYPDGLGSAYNTIPDLRTPKMELGLSVNLTWQTGLDFDVDL